MRYTIALFFLFLIVGCNNNNSSKKSGNSYSSGYEDGTYCAEVEYYYQRTGTQADYTLEVEIEDNQLVKIYWPNGGWLDISHFSAPDISYGSADFESDRGINYTVEIIGESAGCYTSGGRVSEESFLYEARKSICPICGGRKNRYDSACDDCTDEAENTCSRCGGFEYYVYGGLCSNCQEEDEEEERSFFSDEDDY